MENKNFVQIYIDTLTKNYANSSGRARRREYWGFFLINLLVSMAFGVVVAVTKIDYINTIYSVAVLLPSICLGIRRMHDVGKSGWFLLIPIYNFILAVTAGEAGSNEYGADPKGTSEDEVEEIGQNVN